MESGWFELVVRSPLGQARARLARGMAEPEPYAVRPIGVVRSQLRPVDDASNQREGAPEAVIEIDPGIC